MFARTLLTGLLAAAAMVSGSAIPASTLHKRDVTTVSQCKVPGQVALTFDDGPYIHQQKLRETFGQSKATFFLNGKNWGCIYDRADDLIAAYNAGHTIGNHGWSHAHMGQLTWDQVHDELWRVEEAMIKILGVKPLYFRPPFGEVSDTLYAALANRGYKKLFLWSDDSGDSSGASVDSMKNLYNNMAASYPQPHLVLNHETYDTVPYQVIPHAVSVLKNAGYQLVAVDTCMADEGEWPYQYVGPPQQRDTSWVC